MRFTIIHYSVLAVVAALASLQAGFSLKAFMGALYVFNGDAAVDLGDMELAEWSFERAREWDPHDYMTLYKLGLTQKRLQQGQAVEALEASAALAPNYYPAIMDLAEMYAFENRLDEAETLADRAAAGIPFSWRAQKVAGVVKQARGDHGAAVAHFREARELSPDTTAELISREAASRYELGDVDEALALFDHAIEATPSVPENHLLKGRILFEREAYGKAVGPIEKGLEFIALRGIDSPKTQADRQFAYFMLCRAYLETGELRNASEALMNLAYSNAAYPGIESLSRELVDRFQAKRDELDSAAVTDIQFRLGSALSATRDFERAETLLKDALPKLEAGRRAQGTLELVSVLTNLERYDEAIALAEGWVQESGSSLAFSMALGDLYSRAGRTAQARLQYVRLLNFAGLTSQQRADIEWRLENLPE